MFTSRVMQLCVFLVLCSGEWMMNKYGDGRWSLAIRANVNAENLEHIFTGPIWRRSQQMDKLSIENNRKTRRVRGNLKYMETGNLIRWTHYCEYIDEVSPTTYCIRDIYFFKPNSETSNNDIQHTLWPLVGG